MDSDSDIYRSQSPMTKLQDRLTNCYKVQKTSEQQMIQPKVSSILQSKTLSSREERASPQSSHDNSFDPTSLAETSNAISSHNPFSNNWKDYDSILNNQQVVRDSGFNSTPSFTEENASARNSNSRLTNPTLFGPHTNFGLQLRVDSLQLSHPHSIETAHDL